MSQQGLRQASLRAVTGSTTNETYDGDWNKLFDLDSIPVGTTDERMLQWINAKLTRSYTNLAEAQQALATANGAWNFSSMGTFDAT